MLHSYPCIEQALVKKFKCVSCRKKVAHYAPVVHVDIGEGPTVEDATLHPACVPTWVEKVQWPGGLEAFARELNANSPNEYSDWPELEPYPEELARAAGPVPSRGDGQLLSKALGSDQPPSQLVALASSGRWYASDYSSMLRWLTAHGELADVRVVLADRRWSALVLSEAFQEVIDSHREYRPQDRRRGVEFMRTLLAAVDARESRRAAEIVLQKLARFGGAGISDPGFKQLERELAEVTAAAPTMPPPTTAATAPTLSR